MPYAWERRQQQYNDFASIWHGSIPLEIEIGRCFRCFLVVRQRSPLIIIWSGFLALLALLYVGHSPPVYGSTAQILLQPRQIINDGPEDMKHYHQFIIDSQQCETELNIIKSERILSFVYDILEMGDVDAKSRQGTGKPVDIKGLNPDEQSGGVNPAKSVKIKELSDGLRVRRIGLTYIIDISYFSNSREYAAKVSNAIAGAYVLSKLLDVLSRTSENGSYKKARRQLLLQQIEIARDAIRRGIAPNVYLPDSDVRFIGEGVEPVVPLYPKKMLVGLLFLTMGMLSGTLAVLIMQELKV